MTPQPSPLNTPIWWDDKDNLLSEADKDLALRLPTYPVQPDETFKLYVQVQASGRINTIYFIIHHDSDLEVEDTHIPSPWTLDSYHNKSNTNFLALCYDDEDGDI